MDRRRGERDGARLFEGRTLNSSLVIDVDCAFDGSTGQGTVSRDALAALRGLSGSLDVYQERTQVVDAGSYAIAVIARAVAVASSEGGGLTSNAACTSNSSGAVFR